MTEVRENKKITAHGKSLRMSPWEFPQAQDGISLYSPHLVPVQIQHSTVHDGTELEKLTWQFSSILSLSSFLQVLHAFYMVLIMVLLVYFV